MRKIFLIISLLFIALTFIPAQASAFNFNFPSFKPFPTFKPLPTPTPKPSPQIKLKEIKINGDYKKNKSIVEVGFSNLDNVKFISFSLIYTHNGVTEGVFDSFSPNGVKKFKKDIFLGSCSTGICKPHLNPINIKLQADGFYTNNQSFSKAINIK
jgi:hypothetical protein